MVPWRATEDGEVTQDVIDWYARFAEGRPGAIVLEATGIRDVPSGPLLRIGHDRFVPGLRRVVEAVRESSGGETLLLIQLIDFLRIRRRPDPAVFFARHLVVDAALRERLGDPDGDEGALRARLAQMTDAELGQVLAPRDLESLRMGQRERVTDTGLPHIGELPAVLPGLFAAAAARAKEAGFDGVELHYAHAYTMASFLSRLNDRGDGYGGSPAARVRLPLEVYRTVRAAVGADFLLGCRFLSEECIEGGSTLEDSVYYARAFARAGMDFLSLSRGGKFEDAAQPKPGWAAYPYTGRSGYECMPQYISDARGPFGRNVEPTAAIRAAIRADGLQTPVVVCGGVHDFRQAESLLGEDKADIVGFARQALADPDWFRKVRSGHGEAVRLCRYSNYCEGLDQKHKQVSCELWDREGLDAPGVRLSHDGRRRLTAPPWSPGPAKGS
jgi:2,4-dienoyl-CoA reductase-like NADH-dependent reductase (Old Yellow Enzyme family)